MITVYGAISPTGSVEQKTFCNIYRSFDRLWVLLILFFQAAVIFARQGTLYLWQALEKRGMQVQMLTVFITWAGLRFIQSILDAGTQYGLVTRETMIIGMRVVLKSVVAWMVVFGVFYGLIWRQKNSNRRWSYEADQKIIMFLKDALVFIAPELLDLVLFTLPWIRNVIENVDWPIFP